MVEMEPKQFVIQGDVYEVEKLVGVRIVKGQKLYRVRWRGYGRESDTMEPEENLFSCKDMIEDLEQKIKDRHDRKTNKKGIRTLSIETGESSRDAEECVILKSPQECTWQATEVEQGNHSKDTFWRDFDEGKISVSGTVYDKDMYSKVKERAERGARGNAPQDGCKPSEITLKEPLLTPPLCPKVVLKRRPNRTSCDSMTYKSMIQKPISVHIKKRKKYDVLRDYRKRKSHMHRKRKLDENGRRKLTFRNTESYSAEGSANILQELLINDEQKGVLRSEYMVSSSKPGTSGIRTKYEETPEGNIKDGRKSHSLKCRISIQDNTVALIPAHDISPEKESNDNVLEKGPISTMNCKIRRLFSSMLEAVVNDRVDKVERLCSNNFIVNCYQEDGTTALMVAAQLGHFNVTKVLLKANAHKNKQNRKGETALMLACKNGHSRIAKLLLDNGANFTLTDSEGLNVCKITNQNPNLSVIQNIVIQHIVRVMSTFEEEARAHLHPVADIKHALFPIQCFSINEGPKYKIYFQHHVNLESPEKRENQYLLFIASATIKESSTFYQFDVGSLIQNVYINDIKQKFYNEDICSVFKVSGLKNGSNKLSIMATHHPESEVKLVVCAYRVHKKSRSPSRKLKNEI